MSAPPPAELPRPKPSAYDPKSLLNAQPVVVAVISPDTYKVVFQNEVSIEKFGNLAQQTCHEKIAGSAAPCEFCKMREAVLTGRHTAAEVPLPDNQFMLVQWAAVKTMEGEVHVAETITDITAIKRQQVEKEALIRQLEHANRKLHDVNLQLHDRSIRDGLTGLYNHAHFQTQLAHLLSQAERSGSPLSLLFLDLDDFKLINDRCGHGVGDHVLIQIGALLDGHLRPTEQRRLRRASDIAARYGGDEFALLLPNTPLEGAQVVADLLSHRLPTLRCLPELAPLDAQGLSLSCSIGIAAFPTHASTPIDLLAAADAAVYVAKRNGKGQAAVAPSR